MNKLIILADYKREKESVFITTLYEVDWDVHEENMKEDWKEEGRLEGRQIMKTLISYLMKDNRIKDITRVLEDEEYQEKLLKELDLADKG